MVAMIKQITITKRYGSKVMVILNPALDTFHFDFLVTD